MRIAFATDEESGLTRRIVADLEDRGHEVVAVAPSAAWPEVGRAVGAAVATGGAALGVVCCWTGTGVTMAANRVPGVRAALCTDAATAEGARRWNDANVLAMSLRLTTEATAREMLDAFLATAADPAEAAHIAELDS